MTKPLFASKWFKDVPATELRQEIQNLYRETARLEGEKLEPEDLGPLEDSISDLKAAIGDIVGEVGSNANGSWVRFANGLQVCWLHSDQELVTSTGSGGVFYTTFVWTFPQPFIERPAISPGADRSAGGITWGGCYGTSAISAGLYVIGTTASSVGAPTAVAIGRWK